MTFGISPGVSVKEIDITNVIPSVSTTIGAFVGAFNWGPVDKVANISTEKQLAEVFGKPDDNTYKNFLPAAQFLKYTNALRLERATTTNLNATNKASTGLLVKNKEHYEGLTIANDVNWIAKYPGTLGNSLDVHIIPAGLAEATWNAYAHKNQFIAQPDTTEKASELGYPYINDELHVLVLDRTGEITGVAGTVLEKYEGLSQSPESKKEDGTSNYYKEVINNDSRWLWVGGNESTLTDIGKTFNALTTVKNFGAINNSSNYSTGATTIIVDGLGDYEGTTVHKGTKFTITGDTTVYTVTEDEFVTGTGSAATATLKIEPALTKTANDNVVLKVKGFTTGSVIIQHELANATDDNEPTVAEITDAFDKHYKDVDSIDVNFLIAPEVANKADSRTLVNKLQAIANVRKDVIVTVSPPIAEAKSSTTVVQWAKTSVPSSSYTVLDSSAGYVYDKYNDKRRLVQLAGDIAGLCARTDETAEPWFSPAGTNRGILQDIERLAYTPTEDERDTLYKARVNPVISISGTGIVLFGDKTAQTKASAFDRINVRRLFIVIKKAIKRAARDQLFEQNDEFTRKQFTGQIEPFLRNIQGRRGITAYTVVADERNNTPEVIDKNQFVANIYIQPTRSINFIELRFFATRTGVQFDEIIGKK